MPDAAAPSPTPAPGSPFTHRLRVRYVECDMQGHVFNGHYLTWLDIAHTELLRDAGVPYPDLLAAGTDFVVAETGIRFRGAARYDDALDVGVRLDPLTTSTMTSRFTIHRDDVLLTEGWLRHVCVETIAHAKRAWPEHLRAALARYVQPHGG